MSVADDAVRFAARIRVTVVGAGVIGLSIAHDLAVAGATVTVVADEAAQNSVSAVAGGLWFPYSVVIEGDSSNFLIRSRQRFEALFNLADAAADAREGTFVERSSSPDRSWTATALWHRPARADELPPDAPSGIRAALPLVNTPAYLRWLDGACQKRGVQFVKANVRDVDQIARTTRADQVVVAAGGRSPEILGDDTSTYPIRGQIVCLRNPGLSDWLLDDDHPEGLTYVLPRGDEVVCGGTAEPGATHMDCDPEVEAAILDRVITAIPELAGQEVVGRRVGLRPGRPTLRLEALDRYSVPVIACYGHGGAGITLSWGSAEYVTRLVHDSA